MSAQEEEVHGLSRTAALKAQLLAQGGMRLPGMLPQSPVKKSTETETLTVLERTAAPKG